MALGNFNHFPLIAAKLKPACGQIVKEVAKKGVYNVQVAIQGVGAVDTEFMISNVYYTAADGETSYGQGKAPSGDSYLLPQESPPNQTSAVIGAAANYSVYVNYGHHTRSGSWVPARPFWEPGIEQTRTDFETEGVKLESYLRV